MAASALGPVQVQVNPGDLQVKVKRVTSPLLPGSQLDGRRWVGRERPCGRWRLLGQGGAHQLERAGCQHWRGKTGGQSGSPGVCSQCDPGDICHQVNGWLQGEVPTEGEVKAALEATYTR